MRQGGSSCAIQGQVSEQALNCATFNNVNENMFACSGEDCEITVWDVRMPEDHLNTLHFHEQEVTCLDWHPTQEQIVMSGAKDGKVYVWDNSKNGEEQAQGDYEDGPPELVFHHLSHLSQIEDISFSPARVGQNYYPSAVSVETQLAIQIWKPKEDFLLEEHNLL